MPKALILMTKAKTLSLLDGRAHPSGFWAEEFVVPYQRLVREGYDVDIATIGGELPQPDARSLSADMIRWTRPQDAPDDDEERVAYYRKSISEIDALRRPRNIADLTPDDLTGYAGVYISGGHGAMEDMPNDGSMTRVVRWILDLEKPFAVLCHGHSALLPLRDSRGRWPLEGYRMTAFSQNEEWETDLAGMLPFVLQVELQRLGAVYQQAPVRWGSCVVADRNLITGQNPYSTAALTEAFLDRLDG
jgi:putative intracellular protease/amidase